MYVVYFICSFQLLRALLYVLCAFVILNKDYLLTHLLTIGQKRLDHAPKLGGLSLAGS